MLARLGVVLYCSSTRHVHPNQNATRALPLGQQCRAEVRAAYAVHRWLVASGAGFHVAGRFLTNFVEAALGNLGGFFVFGLGVRP